MIRIAMIGAPCTGKTTIAKLLVEDFPLRYVHEYAADCIARGMEIGKDIDQLEITKRQKFYEDYTSNMAGASGNIGLVTDSHLYHSIIYTKLNRPDLLEDVEKVLGSYRYNLALWTMIEDIPMIDNGARRLDEVERLIVECAIEEYVANVEDEVVILRGSPEERYKEAGEAVRRVIEDATWWY